VPADHIAHFIRDLVRNELDLTPVLPSYEDDRGYPPYHPGTMVALLLYAYTQGVYSSRRISGCEERLDLLCPVGPAHCRYVQDSGKIASIFREHDAGHAFAAFSAVGESVADAEKYYLNNVAGTLGLLRGMREAGCSLLVFSSTGAVYGNAGREPIVESAAGGNTASSHCHSLGSLDEIYPPPPDHGKPATGTHALARRVPALFCPISIEGVRQKNSCTAASQKPENDSHARLS
jgi:hypothetical protein